MLTLISHVLKLPFRLLGILLKVLALPLKLLEPRVGCLILILIGVVFFVSCGMLGRLTLVL